jgi:transcriptional regulator with XRE-family HTH domain
MDNKSEIFGIRLKALRNKKGKSQEDVSKAIGISRPRYSHYENNHVEPDMDLIRKIANYHNVNTDYLLGVSDNPNILAEESELEELLNDPNTQLMFKNWKGMSEKEREEAIEMIKYIQFKNKGE